MTNHTAKIAITIPARTLQSIEVERKRTKRSRSSIVTEALEVWLKANSADRRDREYVAAYQRNPEPDDGEVAAAVMASWDSWDKPTRRRK